MADFDNLSAERTIRDNSAAAVKEEQSLDTPAPGQVSVLINLDTDDDDEAPITTPTASHGHRQRQTPGLFVTDTPTPAPMTAPSTPVDGDGGLTYHQRMLATQRKMAAIYRERLGHPKTTPPRPSIPDSLNLMPDSFPQAPKKRGKNEDAIRFHKAKAAYDRKVASGTATVSDEIQYIKLRSEEQSRLRKLAADEAYDKTPSPECDDASESLFIPARETSSEREAPAVRKRKQRVAADEDEDEEQTPKKRSKKKKKTATMVSRTGYSEEDLHRVLTQAANKRAKGTKAPAKKATGGGGGRGRRSGPTMTNLGSIMGTNVFSDTAANKGLRSQPTDFGIEARGKIGSRNDALKSLIASVPLESKGTAQMDKKYLDEAVKAFNGHASCRPTADGTWSVKGMKATLKHYQVLGVAFMRNRENAGEEPRGGILADAMGLGKTIQALVNIVNGKAPPGSQYKSTLIVASPALVSQWYHEIEKHVMNRDENKQYGLGNVIVYRAGSRLISNNLVHQFEQADIVLTTYHEICQSYPKAVVPPQLTTAAQKDEWWRAFFKENRGVFHQARFFRIVLDEAQAIKNHKGHTSMACRALDARFRWAITGTPILNTVKEFYPYFKFLKEPHTGSFAIFKAEFGHQENFCSSDDPDGAAKLSVFLRKMMLRRTHRDKLFDARLLDLPQPKEHILWLEFNEVERQIYEIVKKRFIQRINSISQSGRLEKQYSHIWTMILRLRQICNSTLLLQGTLVDLLEREDVEKLLRITAKEDERSDEGAYLLVHLRRVLGRNIEVGSKTSEGGIQGAVISEAETIPIDVIDAGEPDIDIGGTHGLNFRFRKYLRSLLQSDAWDEIKNRTLCCGCRQEPRDPIVTSCLHVFCSVCLADFQHSAARRGHDAATCCECGEVFTDTQPCVDLDSFQRHQRTRVSPSEAVADVTAPRGKKAKGREKKTGLEDWITMSGDVLPSAKTQAVKAQVLNWMEEDHNAKIIIYTQFLPMVQILARICKGEGWEYVKYTGEMSHDQRDKAITEFGTQHASTRIMLASLRCGGLGLNLTMASRVICVDPWWNAAVEQQAFCRVYRIGQQKETRMTRFVIRNSIDAAIEDMKARKQVEIDQVMNDARKHQKLDIEDLMRLFGPVGEDEAGRAFIFAQTDDGTNEEEHLTLPDMDEEDEHHFLGNEE